MQFDYVSDDVIDRKKWNRKLMFVVCIYFSKNKLFFLLIFLNYWQVNKKLWFQMQPFNNSKH